MSSCPQRGVRQLHKYWWAASHSNAYPADAFSLHANTGAALIKVFAGGVSGRLHFFEQPLPAAEMQVVQEISAQLVRVFLTNAVEADVTRVHGSWLHVYYC